MTVIKFQDVSKKYKLYSKGGLYLRDRITHALGRLNPFNGTRPSAAANCDLPSAVSSPSAPSTMHALEHDFWALKNVSFEIKRGESVGFIGRNGAGKSTILKLLAGVTKPSSGNSEVNGRVAALIEVGAGFHPELTGRENVFLNASILGMKKVEIEKRFDSIVGFAELEDFIDTPVKHYSSGMYVRLGFAIAVHSDPDIFLIDEVLAVGDEAFQRKCLDTLAAHKAAGKTLILVSHDLAKIEEVCSRCIYLQQGQVQKDGAPLNVIKQYRFDVAGTSSERPSFDSELGQSAAILAVNFHRADGRQSSEFVSGEDLIVEIRYWAQRRIDNPVFGMAIHGRNGAHVTGFNTRTCGHVIDFIEGEASIFCRLPRLALNDGVYSLSVELHDLDYTEVYDRHPGRYKFMVGGGREHPWGLVKMPTEWAWNHAGTKRLSSLDSPQPRRKILGE